MSPADSGALREAHRLISSSLTDPSDGGALGELTGAGLLGPLLDQVLKDTADHPAEERGRLPLSYRHPLGFRKISLLLDEPRYALRAHLWPASAAAPHGGRREHIHNHRFPVVSYVAHGSLTTRLYEAGEPGRAGEPMARYREEPDALDPEGWRLRRVGDAAVRTTAELSLTAGTEYRLAADVLHQSAPRTTTPTVTLFLETAGVREGTDVYVPGAAPVAGWTPRRPPGVTGYLRALEELRAFPGWR